MRSGHTRFGFLLGEARQEFRDGFRGPLVPTIWAGLLIYTVIILLNAEYMREMGAIDVPRNSPHVIYLMAAGQSILAFFAWAWIFSQVVLRDRSARQHELVLAAPVSLRALLFARYLGAGGVAIVVGLAIILAMLLTPVLAAIGAMPASASGPTPWLALLWSTLLLVIPTAMGTGALYVMATIRTRSTKGPFAVAALLAFVWMAAMIVLRGGEVDMALASVIDPSAYAEAEEQANHWTPTEKRQAVLALTPPMIVNRILWTGVPFLLLLVSLARVTREDLALEVSSRRRNVASDGPPAVGEATDGRETAAPTGDPPPLADGRPAWGRVLWLEASWHLRLAMRGFGFRLAMILLVAAGMGGGWVNFVQHKTGPRIPTPQSLLPFTAENFYLVLVFMVAAFVGVLVRRDGAQGFGEWFDVCRVPLTAQVLGKATAALAITFIFCALPAVSSLVLSALMAPEAVDPLLPFTYFLGYFFPSLAELCALVLLVHALVRHSGAAYALSMFLAFIAIVNHELGVVEYPPFQIGVPPHIHLSELGGWAPWLPMVAGVNGFKLALAATAIACTLLLWRRGTALRVGDRLHAAATRVRQAPGAMLAVSVLVALALGALLHQQLVVAGEFEPGAEQVAGDAQWEARWWPEASGFTLAGGEVDVTVEPGSRQAELTWTIEDLRTPRDTLHATLPHGVELITATVGDRPATFAVDGDHLEVDSRPCAAAPCRLDLRFTAHFEDWPVEDLPWLHPGGVWLRAESLVPTLGHDPERLTRSPEIRRRHDLDETIPSMPQPTALRPALAVAPAGHWRWRIEFPDGFVLGDTGETSGPLDFASVWLPEPPRSTTSEDRTVWFTPGHAPQVAAIESDVRELTACVAAQVGLTPNVAQVVQAPPETGEIRVYGELLWLPEDLAWGVADEGFGRWVRQYNLARGLTQHLVANRADLRLGEGARWLLEGTSGWVALRCLDAISGPRAALAMRQYQASTISEDLGTVLEPITSIASADGPWLPHYAALALDGWSAARSDGLTPADFLDTFLPELRDDHTILAALGAAYGARDADALLGPLRASDVRVQTASSGLAVGVERWVWQRGGWVAEPPPTRLVLRDLDDPDRGEWLALDDLPTISPTDTLYLRDPTPSFERSFEDNFLAPMR
ncbi:MAG: hypothetical protein AAGE94_05065 [Acidobacteriota bacterium]